jgi:dTDP-4-dehydrorhamnose 3,5-epimerase
MQIPPETDLPPSFEPGTIDGVVVTSLKAHADRRGWLIELWRADELPADLHPVMTYVSETLPGVTRGPHEHRAQADNFAFIGPGEFCLYLWDIRTKSPTYGRAMRVNFGQSNPSAVVVPPGVVHAYKNVSEVPGWVVNQPNRLFAGEGRKEPIDEIRHEDDPHSLFILD